MQVRAEEQSFSNTKRTLLILLREEIEELQQGVMQMRESSLIKAVAKRKVVYNINRQGQMELVYTQMALAEYYLQNNMLDSAARCLNDSRGLRVVGDTTYLLGVVENRRKKKELAQKLFEACLGEEWIEPSQQHRATAQLEAMTQLQQIYFTSGQRDRLKQLSYQKIQLTRNMGGKYSETYFQALAMIDMATIHQAFSQLPLAIEQLDGALALLEGAGQEPGKQVQVLQTKSQVLLQMGKRQGAIGCLNKALGVLRRFVGCISSQSEEQLYECFVRTKLIG